MSLMGKETVTAGSCVVDHFHDSVLFSQRVCAALVLISVLLDKSKCKIQKIKAQMFPLWEKIVVVKYMYLFFRT